MSSNLGLGYNGVNVCNSMQIKNYFIKEYYIIYICMHILYVCLYAVLFCGKAYTLPLGVITILVEFNFTTELQQASLLWRSFDSDSLIQWRPCAHHSNNIDGG